MPKNILTEAKKHALTLAGLAITAQAESRAAAACADLVAVG